MKTASAASIGLVLGLATAFLAAVATIATSALTAAPASIPFVFWASVGEENGLPAVEFEPEGLGMVALVGLVAAGYTLSRFLANRRS